jgi:hypothetical protein
MQLKRFKWPFLRKKYSSKIVDAELVHLPCTEHPNIRYIQFPCGFSNTANIWITDWFRFQIINVRLKVGWSIIKPWLDNHSHHLNRWDLRSLLFDYQTSHIKFDPFIHKSILPLEKQSSRTCLIFENGDQSGDKILFLIWRQWSL